MSDHQSPVDEPPGKDGYQGVTNPDAVPDPPVYPPGANPPGTNPPVEPPVDPSTVPVPGSIPTHDYSGGGAPVDPALGPPVNIDVPYVSFTGDTLSCTMGNWDHEPTSYTYAWKRDGTEDIGTNAPDYTAVAADQGHTITCVVSATNNMGSTAAPPSNGVEIT